ncbi:hypothetical protein [Wolbachia endosymbiont of Folsomia candida]|nr:hypothetical protein [Wolbachia endosymbiont of Folsomia candida]
MKIRKWIPASRARMTKACSIFELCNKAIPASRAGMTPEVMMTFY